MAAIIYLRCPRPSEYVLLNSFDSNIYPHGIRLDGFGFSGNAAPQRSILPRCLLNRTETSVSTEPEFIIRIYSFQIEL